MNDATAISSDDHDGVGDTASDRNLCGVIGDTAVPAVVGGGAANGIIVLLCARVGDPDADDTAVTAAAAEAARRDALEWTLR